MTADGMLAILSAAPGDLAPRAGSAASPAPPGILGLLGLAVGVVVGRVVAHQTAAFGAPTPPGRRRSAAIPALTGVVFLAVGGWLVGEGGPVSAAATDGSGAGIPIAVGYLAFAALGIALAIIDVRVHRLPNALVLPAYPAAGVLLLSAGALGAPVGDLLRATLGGALLLMFYALLGLAGPGAMGGGDVKLAGLIGIVLGFTGWGALAVGSAAAFVLGGAAGLVLLLRGRAGRGTAVPFGPWMIAGAWAGIVAGDGVIGF